MTEHLTPERLREQAESLATDGFSAVGNDLEKLADTWGKDRHALKVESELAERFARNVADLEQRIERLRAERDFLRKEFLSEQEEVRKACEERDRLRGVLNSARKEIAAGEQSAIERGEGEYAAGLLSASRTLQDCCEDALPPRRSAMIDPERIAKLFHEAYERLAPQYGYETRPESAVPWDEVPDNNKRLMTAVCWEVFSGVCREVEELRRDKESYRQDANSKAARVADLEVQRDELRRENARLRLYHQAKDGLGRVAEKMLEGMESPADDIGLPSSELWKLYETDEPTWLPAPDTTDSQGNRPPELADAQMVEWGPLGYWTVERRQVERADKVPWKRADEYRPLYSDSGLLLCSAEGLHEDTKYVATDNDGCVFQYRTKPHLPEDRLYWWLSDSFIGRAPESHRRPGDWRASLMEVMR